MKRFVILTLWLLAAHAPAQDQLKPGVLGEYFDLGTAYTNFPAIDSERHKPARQRIDPVIDFEATTAAFGGTLLEDHLLINWAGKIRVPSKGIYTFYLESDDGARCYINDRLKISNPGLHPMTEKSEQVELTEGDHDLFIEYFSVGSPAGCRFSWKPPGGEKEIVPAHALLHSGSGGGLEPGLKGDLYDLIDGWNSFPEVDPYQPPVRLSIDSNIHLLPTSAPVPGTKLVDYFFVRWTGKIQIPKTGRYKFHLASDDGSRLVIGEQRVVDNGGSHSWREVAGEAELVKGLHDITVEFFEILGNGGCVLYWEGEGIVKQIVPPGALFHLPMDTETRLAAREESRRALVEGKLFVPARWLWNTADAVRAAPADETIFFQKVVTLPLAPDEAFVFAACDNAYTLFINGLEVVSGSAWERPDVVDATSLFVQGTNVISVVAVNGDRVSPAGLVLYACVRKGEQVMDFATDQSWRYATTRNEDWLKQEFTSSDWSAAVELGDLGVPPWTHHLHVEKLKNEIARIRR